MSWRSALTAPASYLAVAPSKRDVCNFPVTFTSGGNSYIVTIPFTYFISPATNISESIHIQHKGMASYRPCSFPRRPSSTDSHLLTEANYQLHLAYYRYQVNTGQYVMSPGEKLTFNLVVLSLLGLFGCAVYYCFLPSAIAGLQRLTYYITGQRQVMLNAIRIMDRVVQQSSGGPVASLKDVGVIVALNANDTDVFAMR